MSRYIFKRSVRYKPNSIQNRNREAIFDERNKSKNNESDEGDVGQMHDM